MDHLEIGRRADLSLPSEPGGHCTSSRTISEFTICFLKIVGLILTLRGSNLGLVSLNFWVWSANLKFLSKLVIWSYQSLEGDEKWETSQWEVRWVLSGHRVKSQPVIHRRWSGPTGFEFEPHEAGCGYISDSASQWRNFPWNWALLRTK